MDKKILRTLAVLTVGFGINAVTTNNAAAEMTYKDVHVDTVSACLPLTECEDQNSAPPGVPNRCWRQCNGGI